MWNAFWAAVAIVGTVGSVAFLLWLQAKGSPEREAEEAARDYFDRHGHWPDEEPT
jgi:hypothetical protein